ncbi:cuticlin-6-like [Branchiostoma lanceolatum]|uniref:cuticlin-6-like n=1 Tax=Branchiostoma lanceolatum TaxID=7740 RepID=UPI003456F4EB
MQKGGQTRAGLAIRFMKDTSDFRIGVPRAAVVLTDGQSASPVQAEADAARAAGIELYAVSIGDLVDNAELEVIGGSSDHVFNSDDPCNVATRILADLCDLTGCPDDEPMVYCFADPCTVTACPATPDATCVSNYCGGCHADFFDRDGEPACCGGHGQPCDTGLPIGRVDDCRCQGGLLCFRNAGTIDKGTCQTQEWVNDNGGLPNVRG